MPIFDFYCNKCEKNFEALVASNDKVNCVCGELAAKKVSGCSFHLSGDGWFKQGYGLEKSEA